MNDKEHSKREAQEVKEILSVVSAEVPALIKGVVASVFSEEAGRSMGKGAAAYYKALKEGGLPEDVAVKMTQDYVRTFTNLGDVLKNVRSRRYREEDEDTHEKRRDEGEDDEEEEE